MFLDKQLQTVATDINDDIRVNPEAQAYQPVPCIDRQGRLFWGVNYAAGQDFQGCFRTSRGTHRVDCTI